jgi:integrase
MRRALTPKAIEAIKPPPAGKRRIVLDALVPGFGVRITDTGAKSYVLVGRFGGSRNPTASAIGKVGAITLEQARVQAREWLAVVAAGGDPAEVQRQREEGTLRAIVEEYAERECHRLRSGDRVRHDLERLVLPVLGSRPIAEIKRSDIVRLLDRVEDENGPMMANRTLSQLRRVMNWYAVRSDDFRSPIVRGMSRGEEVARDRILSDDELRAFWSATAGGGVLASWARFLLLTGARRSEAAGLRWTEIVDGVWTLPAARNKTGVDLVRPLSKATLEIIEAQPKAGVFVFQSSVGTTLTGFQRYKGQLDATVGVGWVWHDLRRTARSLLARAGVTTEVAEQCLGHVLPNIQKIYNRHSYQEEMLLAYEKLSALIGQIVDPQENVVPLRGGRG